MAGQFVLHALFGSKHDDVDRAESVGCPRRRFGIENGAAPANFTALEESLVAIDRRNDIKKADFIRRPRQGEAPSHALGGHDQASPGQFGKQLGQIFGRNALKVGEVANAWGRRLTWSSRQIKQAVQPIFNADADE